MQDKQIEPEATVEDDDRVATAADLLSVADTLTELAQLDNFGFCSKAAESIREVAFSHMKKGKLDEKIST